MSITATVENDSVKLPAGFHVPDGTKVEIHFPGAPEAAGGKETGSFFDSMRDLIGSAEGPEDLAAQHDHYAHGAPKRTGA